MAPPNLVKLAQIMTDATKCYDAALAEFASIERLTTSDSYVMGYIRCCKAGTQSAIDFIRQCKGIKDAHAGDKKST